MQARTKIVHKLLERHVRCVGYSIGSRSRSDFLHESIVPTDHFQKSLPKLSVPKLDDTCKKYLDSQKAFLSPEAFQQTQNFTNEFKDGVGKDLHETLLKFDKENKHTSYVTGFWFDMYLKDRRPVLLNHNPFMAFNPAPTAQLSDQLVRSTNMVVSSLKYLKTLRANVLEPLIYHMDPSKSDTQSFKKFARMLPKSLSWYGAYWYKAFPLDMSQFPSLFNSTRIPTEGKDILYKDEKAKHLLVIRNGNMYTFDCFDRDGNILPASQIMANLQYILEDKSERPSHPLGYLTAENRDVWAKARARLVASGNSSQLEMVDTALFALCLDTTHPDDMVQLAKQYLYGDLANRWCDKSVSLFVTPEGGANVNFEHSWGDGVAVLSYFNSVFADSNENPAVVGKDAVAGATPSVNKIEFTLDDANRADIDAAKIQVEASTDKLMLNFLEYDGFGNKDFKKHNLKGDAMIQLSFQMAYKRVYGKTPATYESASTSAFKHGRTETVRPATVATNIACDLIRNAADKGEIMAALNECSNVHGTLTKNAAMGKGWDRHLYALRHFAEAENLQVPIFTDDSYKDITTITLSTSTLASPAVQLGGFAPVVPHGLGVGYGVHDNRLGAVVSTYKPHNNPDDFLSALHQSINELQKILS